MIQVIPSNEKPLISKGFFHRLGCGHSHLFGHQV